MAKISSEYNLKVILPDFFKEWDHKKNHPLKLEDFTDSSNKKVRWIKVWWICKEKQHSYDALIYNRTRGSGCRYCYLEGRT